MKKLLSIIIPTYNMEALLDQCLTSLILPDKEKRSKLDVIVVIDCATDRSSEIAHGYESRYPETFRVLDKKNGNYGSCVNAALPLARIGGGKYVRILDADDSYYTENLSDYLDLLERVDADLILSPCYVVNAEGTVTEKRTFSLPTDKEFLISDIPLSAYIGMHSIAYRSSIFEEFDYHQTEGISYTDAEWAVAPMQRVRTVRYFDRPVYRYLVGRDGQTMDHLTILRKLGDEEQSLFAQLKTLDTVAQDNMARPWMQHMTDDRVLRLYGIGLSRHASIDLNEFDEKLKREHPDEYKRASNFTLPVFMFNLQMHPARMWRRVHCRWGLFLFPKYIMLQIASRFLMK